MKYSGRWLRERRLQNATAAHLFAPVSMVAAVARTANSLDLFIAGRTEKSPGKLVSMLGLVWARGWLNLGSVNALYEVTVLPWSLKTLDLFTTDSSGIARTPAWREGDDWASLRDKRVALPTDIAITPITPVTAVGLAEDSMDVFVLGLELRYPCWSGK